MYEWKIRTAKSYAELEKLVESIQDDRLQKFKDSLDDLKVTTPEYQRMLAHLNATFSKETVADLRLYNQALSALNQAFPEQAEEIRNLQKEAERLAEKKEELRLLEQQGRTAIELFNSSLLKQFYTTEELEEKQETAEETEEENTLEDVLVGVYEALPTDVQETIRDGVQTVMERYRNILKFF